MIPKSNVTKLRICFSSYEAEAQRAKSLTDKGEFKEAHRAIISAYNIISSLIQQDRQVAEMYPNIIGSAWDDLDEQQREIESKWEAILAK